MSERMYKACPNCGALGVVNEKCEFCGTPIPGDDLGQAYDARIVLNRTVSATKFAEKISIYKWVGDFDPVSKCANVSIGEIHGIINFNGDIVLPLEYSFICIYHEWAILRNNKEDSESILLNLMSWTKYSHFPSFDRYELSNKTDSILEVTCFKTIYWDHGNTTEQRFPFLYDIDKQEAEQSGPPKGGCYIATCIYGSYDCPEVWTLRRYRDHTLAESWYGRAFIKAYYAISPSLVKWFGDTFWFKRMWNRPLDKLVSKLKKKGVADTPYQDIY